MPMDNIVKQNKLGITIYLHYEVDLKNWMYT